MTNVIDALKLAYAFAKPFNRETDDVWKSAEEEILKALEMSQYSRPVVHGIPITTRSCGYCQGSGREPDPSMIEACQNAIERGLIDSNQLMEVTREVRKKDTTEFDRGVLIAASELKRI